MKKTEIISAYTVTIFKAEDEVWGEHIREEWKDQNGDIHRDSDEPAIICKDVDTGEVIHREWFQNGLRHRDDGKAAIKHNAYWGMYEEYYMNDVLHRDNDLPAIYEKTNKGVVTKEEYYINGVEHRKHGPSSLRRSADTGIATIECHKINGVYSRKYGPASIYRSEYTGITVDEAWFFEGKLYRPDGNPPKVKRDSETGEIIKEVFGNEPEHNSPNGPSL